MFDQVTPLILTLNEQANLERVLERLTWAREVVVVDSGSTDATQAVLARFENVRCVERKFDSHAAQWNHGLTESGIVTEWVLALDADYVLSREFIDELQALAPAPEIAAFRVGFRYCVFGEALHGSLYPPVVALYRRIGARYVQDGHTQRILVDGFIGQMKCAIFHDDRKPLSRWLNSQSNYAKLEVDLICSKSWRELAWPDRLRKLVVVMPPLAFVYCLLVRRGLFDGWRGLYYAIQRAVAEAILSLLLLERTITKQARASIGSKP